MKKIGIGMLIIISIMLFSCEDLKKVKTIAEPEIAVFQKMYNDQEFEGVLKTLDMDFFQKTPGPEFYDVLNAVYKKLGKIKSSKNENWKVNQFNSSVTAIFIQDSIYERGQGKETYVYKIVKGKAIMIGYNINSVDLLK